MTAPEPSIVRRCRALLVMIERGTDGEAAAARKIYEALIRKYDLDPAAFADRPRERHCKIEQNTKWMFLHVLAHLGMAGRVWNTVRRNVMVVSCTDAEWAVSSGLYTLIVQAAATKRAQQVVELRSYLIGYMDTAMPVAETNTVCPACGVSRYDYLPDDRRYVCGECGHRGPLAESVLIDPAAHVDGVRDGRKRLSGRAQIEYAAAGGDA